MVLYKSCIGALSCDVRVLSWAEKWYWKGESMGLYGYWPHWGKTTVGRSTWKILMLADTVGTTPYGDWTSFPEGVEEPEQARGRRGEWEDPFFQLIDLMWLGEYVLCIPYGTVCENESSTRRYISVPRYCLLHENRVKSYVYRVLWVEYQSQKYGCLPWS